MRTLPGVHSQVGDVACSAVHCLMLLSSKGYVHRDIKPENVLLTADGHCKMVSSFAFARLCELYIYLKPEIGL
jgi:serine/threonine protein kinase